MLDPWIWASMIPTSAGFSPRSGTRKSSFNERRRPPTWFSIGPNAQETGYLGALRWMIDLRLKMTSLRYGPEQIGPS
jgi:hypothetical protein